MAGLQAQMRVEASSEAFLQSCSRLLQQADRPSAERPRPAAVQQRSPARADVENTLQARRQSGSQASTSQRLSSLQAATTDAPQTEEPLGPRDDDVRCLPCCTGNLLQA